MMAKLEGQILSLIFCTAVLMSPARALAASVDPLPATPASAEALSTPATEGAPDGRWVQARHDGAYGWWWIVNGTWYSCPVAFLVDPRAADAANAAELLTGTGEVLPGAEPSPAACGLLVALGRPSTPR